MENLQRITKIYEKRESIKDVSKTKTNWKIDEKKNNRQGINLIALVVTIVVLLILAGITINLLLGNGGIFDIANQSKIEYEIGALKDRINNVIADWSVERLTKPGVTVDDLWDKMVDADIISDPVEDYVEGPEKEGENDVYQVTTNEGYIVEVIVSPDGNVIIGEVVKGDKLPPKIVEVKSSSGTSNIHVEVTMSRWKNGTISYYYKKDGEEDTSYQPFKENTTELTANIEGLEQNVVYNIKVVANADNGSTQTIINERTGELREGTISQVGETIWSNGTATIELETTEKGVTIQYQIDRVDGEWQEYKGPITGLNHNQTVYAVITDGTNQSGYTSIDILDEEEPKVTVTKETVTTNSIQVSINSSDAEWGMPDTIIYNYYIKQISAGSYPQEATHTGTETNYIFMGLTQGTSYDVKVTVADKAGNIGTGEVTNITTNTVGGANENLKEGNIIATDPAWSNGTASITLNKGTGVASNLTIQYQVGATTGNWSTGEEGASSVTVTGLSHNSVVYARLTDGNNVGSYASITILDLTPPSIPTVNTNGYVSDIWTNTNVTLSFSSSDNESGLLKYQWSTDLINIYDITNPYTWTTDTRTGFYVRAVDNAGNYSSWGGGVIIAKDATPPQEAAISLSTTSTINGGNVTATVTHTDYLSGVNITSCRWVYNTTAGKIGTSITNYPNTFTSNGQTISLSATNPGTYYLHVLTVDNAGNATETVSSAITVTQVTDLYNAGVINTALVGGFTRQRSSTMFTSGWSGSGYFSMEDSYISMGLYTNYTGGSNGNRAEGFLSNYQIDLTNYSYLKFVVDSSNNQYTVTGGDLGLRFGVFDRVTYCMDYTRTGYDKRYDSKGESIINQTYTIDIREINGSYYIGSVIFADLRVTDAAPACKIHRIYLEK